MLERPSWFENQEREFESGSKIDKQIMADSILSRSVPLSTILSTRGKI